ncbi:Hippurate hydrolase [Thiomonas sp. X19]|uniref:M20 aminoacylase family protein n=1 Tax=Thiomonas sp. X19 TaxID=1050370 RepID=UPI000B71D0A2|nr:M20 aminoacylase family protein [Thiomonas sp. X19]SCC91773.1 Hippurate hydrolase [Thiomonas sp. X19]
MWNLTGPIQHISNYHAELTRVRRDLHAHPELGFAEHRTAQFVATELSRYGADEVHAGIGRTGVVGVIRGRLDAKPCPDVPEGAAAESCVRAVGLRADMDALPIKEDNDFPWRSSKGGVMHACGHDGHTAMLLGAARYLAATRNFAGTVHCIFQPGEEGLGGAKAMMDDGLFERFPTDWVFSMHNWPALPPGRIGLTPGPMMAAADRITIKVTAEGGHGAHPYMTIDPVLVSAHIITAVQSIVARNVNPLDEAVVSICAMQGGDLSAMSVIPRQVTLVGTVRTFRAEVQALVEKRLGRIVQSVAQAFGASAELHYERIYPATINTPQVAHYAAEVAAELVGDAAVVRDLPPSMGAEDFAFMLQARPGAYLRLGQGCEAGGFLHTPRYDFNDAVLPLGAALYARLAERALSQVAGTML